MSPAPPHEQDSKPELVGKRLHLVKQSNQLAVACQMPLWEAQGPQQVYEDGSVQPGCSILYYQPFSTTDLNWKHHNPAYSDKLQAMTDLLESIFYTHQPTWDNCHQFLMYLLTTEERRCISTEARKWIQGQVPAEVLDVERWEREVMPEMRPCQEAFNRRLPVCRFGSVRNPLVLINS